MPSRGRSEASCPVADAGAGLLRRQARNSPPLPTRLRPPRSASCSRSWTTRTYARGSASVSKHGAPAPATKHSSGISADMTAPAMAVRQHILASLAAIPTALPELARAWRAALCRDRRAGRAVHPPAGRDVPGPGHPGRAALLAGDHGISPAPDRDAAGHGRGPARGGRPPAGVRARLDRLIRVGLAGRLPPVRLAAAAAWPDRAGAPGGDRGVAHLGAAPVHPGAGSGALPHPARQHRLGRALAPLADRGRRLVHSRAADRLVPGRSRSVRSGAGPGRRCVLADLAAHLAARRLAPPGAQARTRTPTLARALQHGPATR